MTRVKYPSKREISKQIRMIIERSEIFDDDDEEAYIECKPVNSRFKGIRFAACTLMGAAALLAAVALITPFADVSQFTKSHAYGMKNEEQIPKEDDKNSNIVAEDSLFNQQGSSSKIAQVNIVDEAEQQTAYQDGRIVVTQNFSHAQVTLTDESAQELFIKGYEQECKRMRQTLQEQLEERYDVKGESYTAKEETTKVKAALNTRCYEGVTATLDNTISFVYDYSESASTYVSSYSESGSESSFASGYSSSLSFGRESEESSVYYVNYDLETGKKLELKDIFIDAAKAKETIAQEIYKQVVSMLYSGVYESSEVAAVYKNEEKLVGQIDSWTFTARGDMIVYCNQMVVQKTNASEKKTVTKGQQFTISKASLQDLEKNTKYWR